MAETFERILQIFADGKQVCDGNRKIVRGKATMTMMPDLWRVDVVGLSQAQKEVIQQAGSISVTTGKSKDTLFSGRPADIIDRIDNGVKIATLLFLPGEGVWRSFVNLSIRSGVTSKEAVEAILKQSEASVSNGHHLTRKIARGMALFGRAADEIERIAAQNGTKAWTNGETIHLIKKGEGQVAMTLTSGDLLGTPGTMDKTITIDIDLASAPVGRIAKIDKSIYRIVAADVSADTDTGDWMTTITLVDENAMTESEWLGI